MNTIKSILDQTYTNWELIIIDDGSTDNTEYIVKSYLTDKRIKYFKKVNSGATHSRNVGASFATGNFITFLDSDDQACSDWLEEINNQIDDTTAMICCGAIRRFSNGRQVQELPWNFQIDNVNIPVKFTCGSLIVNRFIFNEIGGYDTELKSNQHSDLGIRLLIYLRNSHLKKKAITKSLIIINIHEGERIRTNWRQVSDGSIKFIEKHYQFLHQNKSIKHISSIYSVIAFSNYKLKNKKMAIFYVLKSIKYNPFNFKNYLRTIKYSFF